MNKSNNKRRINVHFGIKSKWKEMSTFEKSNVIGHFFTLILAFSALLELINVEKQYQLNSEQYKLSTDQFKSSVDQFNINYEQQKKANTIAYLQSLHELLNNTDESLLEIIKYYDIENDSISMISCDSLEKILKDNHPYRKQLNDLMNGFNQFAIGCREGFFDEKTAWSANGRMIYDVTKALIPYFELMEKETGRDNDKNEYICCFLRIMVFRWEHDPTTSEKHHKMLDQLEEEAKSATNDSNPIMRRQSVTE